MSGKKNPNISVESKKRQISGMLASNEKRRLENSLPKDLWDFVKYAYTELFLAKWQIAYMAGLRGHTVHRMIQRLGVSAPKNERQGLLRTRENLKVEATVTASAYKHYASVATNYIYKRHSAIVDPKGKRSWDFPLDHVLSVIDGYRKYEKPVSLRVLCHPANFRIVSRSTNAKKQHKSELTLKQLERKIIAYEKLHGSVIFPSHLQLDFASVSNVSPSVKEGLNVMGFDPGSKNFGIFAGTFFGSKTLHKVRIKESCMLTNPITSLKDDLYEEQIVLFMNEITELILRLKPDIIIMERFQSRGLRGLSVELVGLMVGIISGIVRNINQETGRPIVLKLVIASQWKNAVNRQVALDTLYAKLKPSQYHRLDAMLMSMYAYPDKEVFKFVKSKARQNRIIKAINMAPKPRCVMDRFTVKPFDFR